MAAAASLLIAVGWFAWQAANVSWARKQIFTIAGFAQTGQSFDAYDLAVLVRKSLPGDAQTLITSARPEDVPLEGVHWKVDDGIGR